MNKITDITRQDILEVIKDGFTVPLDQPVKDPGTGEFVTEYPVYMPFYGRLDTIKFLSRLYDLKTMPSHDHRYPDALGDISCHFRFGDYEEECWFFDDERFHLLDGDGDEPLLRFICEMLHPIVRQKGSQWKDYLTKFNELLHPDGYELCVAEQTSGRQIYQAREYTEHEVLIPEIIERVEKIEEPGVRDLLEEAIAKHKQPDDQAHRDAVEKIWDAFERLKTYYIDLSKKESAAKLVNDMAGNQQAFFDMFNAEFKALTDIGNQYRIRHHETDKVDITDIRHYDYFFNRCLSLISTAILYLE